MKKIIYFSTVVLFIFVPLLIVISCDNENQHSDEADVSLAGISHKKGFTDPKNPTNLCTVCHGDDLTGESSGYSAAPSCYSCHSALWEEITDEEASFIEGND